MGCGQSKGVLPEPEEVGKEFNKTHIGSDGKAKEAWKSASESAQWTAAVLAHDHNHAPDAEFIPQQSFADLTPRTEHSSTTTAAPPIKQPGTQDPEFDYTHELRAVPAATPVTRAGLAGTEAPSSARPGLLAPLSSSSAAVGGLLSRQPDWLRDSNAPAHTVATYSNSVSGASAAEALGSSSNSKNSRAVAGTSSLPPIGRGIGSSATVASASSSLPPISTAGLLQQSITAASADPAATAALPEPRRLTSNASNHNKGETTPVDTSVTAAGSSRGVSIRNSGNGAARGSLNGSAAAAVGHRNDAPEGAGGAGGSQGIAAGQTASGLPVLHKGSRTSTASRDHDSADPPSAAAPAAADYDPSDPWSALQSQYVAGAGPPSPDASAPGASRVALAYASDSSKHAAAAGGAQGSRRPTSNLVGATTQPQAANKSTELVLMDSDDDDAEFSSSSQINGIGQFADSLQAQQSQQRVAAGLRPGASGSLAAEGSRARIAAGRRAAGGWGDGNMAAAGTLMLGDEESEGTLRKGHQMSVAAATTAHDDVFGDDSPRSSVPGQDSRSRVVGSSSRLAGEYSNQLGGPGHAATAEEDLGVEEIDDVDAMIEAELAAKNALPGDLAAKLAQFEAVAADDED